MDGDEPRGYRTWPCVAYRTLRRNWRRLRRRWFWHGVRFVYHDAYELSLDAVPLDRRRGERILSFLAEEGLVHRDDIDVPRPPSLRNLLRVHDADYLDSLQQSETLVRIFGTSVGDEDMEKVVEMQRTMVGGTIFAVALALQRRGVAINLGGGLHHADRDSGLGFCLFNDIAVAIARLRAKGFSEPVLVVDLDMHDGNGTRAIFAQDPTVHTFSIHNEHWSSTDAVASTAIALGEGVEDEQFLGTLLKSLPDVVEKVKPGLAIYLAGADPAADDAMGSWLLTPKAMMIRDRLVTHLFRDRRRPVPMAVVLGGGYGVNAWKYTARYTGWLLSGRPLEPPANEELLLQRFRRIKQDLDPRTLTSDNGEYGWRLTEEDLVGIVPGLPQQTRFLGYFSRHGVELLLERFGILDQLRVRGYRHPQVAVDLTHPLGQTLRIVGGSDRSKLLVELRVDRSQRLLRDREVIVVEWLLLQNPRAHFGPYRRPLPGQSHPGLGMLRDVLGWLVMLCEILELDGIYFVPSSYHVAAQSRQIVRFLHPEYEAAFRVLRETLAELPLAEASRKVDEGAIRIASTGEVLRWEGYAMVLPVSERLKEQVYGKGYEAQVEESLEGIGFEIIESEVAEPVGMEGA